MNEKTIDEKIKALSESVTDRQYWSALLNRKNAAGYIRPAYKLTFIQRIKRLILRIK